MTSPSDIFRDTVNAMLCNVHTSLPGIIKEYDPTSNKATIQPALNKNFTSGEIPLPILENVPILFPVNIRFPVNVGDYVLLIFTERSIDLWLSVGGQVTPTDPRKFDLSDAIAIPGLMPFTQTFPDNNNQDFVISYAGSVIRIKQSGAVVIETANTVAIGTQANELLDIMSQVIAAVADITTLIPPGEEPPFAFPIDNAATFTALQSRIDAIKGTIP